MGGGTHLFLLCNQAASFKPADTLLGARVLKESPWYQLGSRLVNLVKVSLVIDEFCNRVFSSLFSSSSRAHTVQHSPDLFVFFGGRLLPRAFL